MQSKRTKFLLAALAAATVGSAGAQPPATPAADLAEAPVAVSTHGLPTFLAQRIEAEARKGITPLRQYVHRTKFIHQLDLPSLVVTPEKSAEARARAAGIRVAERAFPGPRVE